MENKNYKKFILLIIVCIIIIILGLFLIVSKNSKGKNSTDKSGDDTIKNNTYEYDIEQIKNNFNESKIEIDSNESVSKCPASKEALDSMMKSLTKNKLIDNRWSCDVNTYYQEQNNVAKSDRYQDNIENVHIISLEYDFNGIKTEEEARNALKDFSKIIWESLNVIYNNPNISNVDDTYFKNLRYQVWLKRDSIEYFDEYGNKQFKNNSHFLTFYISKETYNKINKSTFPSILDNDYFRIFNLGKIYFSSYPRTSEEMLILDMLVESNN